MIAALLLACGRDLADPGVAAAALPPVEAAARQLDAAGVRFLRDQDWCHGMADRRGTWADTAATTCSLTIAPATPFDATATADYAARVSGLRASGVPVQWVLLDHDASGVLATIEVALDGGPFRPVSWVWTSGPPPQDEGNEQRVAPVPGRSGWSVVVGDWP